MRSEIASPRAGTRFLYVMEENKDLTYTNAAPGVPGAQIPRQMAPML